MSRKYIFSPSGVDEFYDLDSDPHEIRNIIKTIDKSELKRHREMLVADMEANGDPLLVWAQSIIID